MPAQTRYAPSGDAHIAYQIEGEGPLELLELSNGVNISIDETAGEPHWEHYVSRLASFSRLIRFDLRGVGLSDPLSPSQSPTLESTIEDALSVLDAAGAERVALLGPGFGGAAAVLLAATHPERVRALVLANSTARWLIDDDYPYGFRPEDVFSWSAATIDPTGTSKVPEELNDAVLYAPSLATEPTFRQWWSRASQRGASPSSARALAELYNGVDVRSVLSSVSVPTLVVHRNNQFLLPIGHGEFLAEHVPGAELVILPGSDTLPFGGNVDELIDPIEEFLTGGLRPARVDRVLATIMFTDVVGSTEQLAELGDRRWHEVLLRYEAMVERQLKRFSGHLVKRTGDGELLTFEGPARAIGCAISIVAGARQLGIVLRIGLHTGEIELLDDDIGGIAVHIASRVTGTAGPGEILVSRTVRDLVAGSGIAFEDRGSHLLRGVPEPWQLFAVAQS